MIIRNRSKKSIKFNGRTLCLLFGFICIGASLKAQQITYRLEWRGDSIGYMTAKKVVQGNVTNYEIESKTKIRMLLSFEHSSHYKAKYTNDFLESSFCKNVVNDKTKAETKVTLKNGIYKIERLDEDDKTFHDKISESIVGLYFNEPSANRLFSENYGGYCDLRKLSNHSYELVKPDDNTNIYYFENGLCVGATFNLSLATIKVTKVN